MQRVIEFTTDTFGAEKIESALRAAFDVVGGECPAGVRLAYWKVQGTSRFVALIDLDDERNNPLLSLDATAALPKVIGSHVESGYPMPQPVELIGSYGFAL